MALMSRGQRRGAGPGQGLGAAGVGSLSYVPLFSSISSVPKAP